MEKLQVGYWIEGSCLDFELGSQQEHAFAYTHPAISVLNISPEGQDPFLPGLGRTSFLFDRHSRMHFSLSELMGSSSFALEELHRAELERLALQKRVDVALETSLHPQPSPEWKLEDRVLRIPEDLGVLYSDLTGLVDEFEEERPCWVFSGTRRRR
jgi:hypothetical protein